MNGKGDAPRPITVDAETYRANWERTFGNPPEPEGNEAPAFIDLAMNVIKVPITLRRPLDRDSDPETAD